MMATAQVGSVEAGEQSPAIGHGLVVRWFGLEFILRPRCFLGSVVPVARGQVSHNVRRSGVYLSWTYCIRINTHSVIFTIFKITLRSTAAYNALYARASLEMWGNRRALLVYLYLGFWRQYESVTDLDSRHHAVGHVRLLPVPRHHMPFPRKENITAVSIFSSSKDMDSPKRQYNCNLQ